MGRLARRNRSVPCKVPAMAGLTSDCRAAPNDPMESKSDIPFDAEFVLPGRPNLCPTAVWAMPHSATVAEPKTRTNDRMGDFLLSVR